MTSKIKVDNINKVSDDSNIIKKCGTTTTIGSGASNPIVVDGSAVTLGRCGGTVALASGATQTGFGRTGTVDWNTTPKTATFTAVSGDGFFANTTGSAFNMNLPAGVAGAIVSVADYAGTWQTNALTVVPNGTDKIGGVNANVVLNTEGQSVTFIFVDSTQGWINTMDSTSNERGATFICASVSGSCNTLVNAPCGNFKIATFKGPGSFTVSSISGCATNNKLDYIIAAGGGSGAEDNGGGGGAGGIRFATETSTMSPPAPASPKAGASSVTASVQAYPIAVGGGAQISTPPAAGSRGTASTALGLTATGGGGGGPDGGSSPEKDGGSGGGTGQGSTCTGNGNDPSVTPPQGQPGGTSPSNPGGGGGGGGFIVTGGSTPGQNNGGTGGAGGGFPVELIGTAAGVPCGSFRYLSGGGGGGVGQPASGSGGAGGLGGGAAGGPNGNPAPAAGAINTGGGGGGGGQGASGTAGGSGIVVIRYRFQ